MLTRCVLLLMLAGPAVLAGDSFRGDQLEVTLVSECTRLQAGATALVGLHFVLQPGWHLYWRNPGDSGLPPRVSWELPDGYEVSDLMWPAPRRIPVPPLMTFGYDDEAGLLAEITVPRSAAGTTATLVAHVSWMTCADVCVEGRARLELQLPVAAEPPVPDPRGRAPIEAARGRIPRAAEQDALTAGRHGDAVLLAVRGARPEAYFPAGRSEIEYAAPQPVEGNTLRLRPATTRTTPLEALDGVLVLADGRAWIVDVPVGDETQSPSSVGKATPERLPDAGPSWAFFLGVGLVVALALVALIYFFA